MSAQEPLGEVVKKLAVEYPLWEEKREATRGTYLCEVCRYISIERLCSSFTFFPTVGIFEAEQNDFPKPPRLPSMIDGEEPLPECSFCEYLYIFPTQTPFLAKLNEIVDDFQRPYGPKLGLTYHPDWKGPRVMATRYDLDIWTDEGDPAMDFGVRARRAITSTQSKSTVEWISEKLLQCTSSHVRCRQAHAIATKAKPIQEATRIGNLPARLIDLNAHGSLDARLVETGNISNPAYATLSYCWGANTNTGYKTTALNLAEHQQRIYYSSLPLTIRNAFDITRGLGLQYLWIDALCIIQGSASDWEKESANMHGTYGNAYVTLAAETGQDVDSGIFNKSSTPISLRSTHLASQLSDGRTSSLHFYLMASADGEESLDSVSFTEPLTSSVLASRAWAFQERRLSPRIVHFKENQAIWECREFILSEDNTWHAPIPSSSRNSWLAPSILFEPLKDLSVLPDFWYGNIDGVLARYTACQLTFPSDKLPALSGIAAKIATSTTSPYIAGLWLDHALQRGLAWRRRIGDERTWTHRPERGPSFSWVAWDGLLRWSSSNDPPAFVVENHTVELKDSSQFGRVGRCSLTLTGHVVSGSIKRYKADRITEDHHAHLDDRRSGSAWMDREDSPDIENVEFLQIYDSDSTALILEKTERGEYRRLGIADLDQQDTNLFVGSAGKTITLI